MEKVTIKKLAELADVRLLTIQRRIKDGFIKVEKPDGYHTLIELNQFEGKDLKKIFLKRKKNNPAHPSKSNFKRGNIAINCTGNIDDIIDFLSTFLEEYQYVNTERVLQSKYYFLENKILKGCSETKLPYNSLNAFKKFNY